MTNKALLVEHIPGAAVSLIQELEAQGWECSGRSPGGHLLTLIQHNPPQLLVLDDDCPHNSAAFLCRSLKLGTETARVPILLLHSRDPLARPVTTTEAIPDLSLSRNAPREQVRQVLVELRNRLQLGQRGVYEVRFRIPSATDHLEELLREMGPLLLWAGLTHDQMKRLLLAVREMGTNAIEWGHRKHFDKPVLLTCRLEPERVSYTIRDSGPGFDPGQLPHAAVPGNPMAHLAVREACGLREGGFGILMTRGLVDEMSYNSTGNEVQLVMNITRPTEVAARRA